MNEQAAQSREEIEILKQTQHELTQGKQKLTRIFERIDKEKVSKWADSQALC